MYGEVDVCTVHVVHDGLHIGDSMYILHIGDSMYICYTIIVQYAQP